MLLSESPRIEVFNSDCLKALRDMEENQYDLAIVDPPYTNNVEGLKVGYNKKNNRADFNYDSFVAPTEEYIEELFRVSKNQIIWGFNYFLEILPNTNACIFWNKHQNGHFSEGELAWCSLGKTRIFDRAFGKDLHNKIHPTQKPIQLYNWILDNYAEESDKILDTHGGSMSIAIACYYRGFELDIYELEAEYFNTGIKRFKQLTAQTKLQL